MRRSLAFSAADSYVGLVLQLASTAILSRILTPVEVGIFAIAAVFSSLASNFRDFGVAEYLIQEQALTPDKIRAAFGVNIAVSWLMGLLIFSASGLTGEFYRSPGITDVMRVQALSFILIPFGAINMAWFRREMNFKPQFVAGLLANTISFGVSVACALNGLGAMSLAWSSLAGVAVTVAVSMWFRPKTFPRLPGLKGVAAVLHFGKFASGIYVFGQLGKGAPEMIIGRALSIAGVAVFSRANGLVQIFHQLVVKAVMPVCLPYFAKAVREEQSVVRGYVAGVSFFTALGWPFLGFMALAAFPSIRIVYGDQWAESVPLAKILCVAGAVELVHYLAKEALLAHGLVKLSSRLQILLQACHVLGLLAVIPFGLLGGCWGVLAASVAGLLISQWHLWTGVQLRWAHLWQACRGSFVVTAITLTPMLVSLPFVSATESNYGRFMIFGGVATALMWLLALRITRHALWSELAAVAGVVATRVRARRGPVAPPA